MLGGRPAPGVHPGQGGGHRGRAAVDWWAEAPKPLLLLRFVLGPAWAHLFLHLPAYLHT